MRVVGGRFKGHSIKAPTGAQTRPTSDRVREALFSILSDKIEAASVLDLFAGSGALGIESLSRGAERVDFVERSSKAVRVIEENLAHLKLDMPVYRGDARSFLRRANACYDLVFVDPPYRLAQSLASDLEQNLPQLLNSGALVVVESDRRDPLALNLPVSDTRQYGDTLITIYVPSR